MRCPKCGQEASGNKCQNCGAPLHTDEEMFLDQDYIDDFELLDLDQDEAAFTMDLDLDLDLDFDGEEEGVQASDFISKKDKGDSILQQSYIVR